MREGDLGATSDSKAGRGCDLVCKEYNPTVSKEEEHSRSSDINQTTLIDCWMIAGHVHRNKAGLRVKQEVQLAGQGKILMANSQVQAYLKCS